MTTNPDSTDSTGDAARQQAGQITGQARGAAQDMAGTTRQEAAQVKDEALGQAKSLAASAKDEVLSQASTQQQRLAQQSRVTTDDLQRLVRGEQPESDLVSQVLSSVAERAHRFTTALETKQPEDLLTDVRRFAARRPGTFLAVAAGIGLVAGRLTRGLADHDDASRPSATPATGSPARPMPVPVDPTFDLPGSVDGPVPVADPLSDPLFGAGPGEVPGNSTGPTDPGSRP